MAWTRRDGTYGGVGKTDGFNCLHHYFTNKKRLKQTCLRSPALPANLPIHLFIFACFACGWFPSDDRRHAFWWCAHTTCYRLPLCWQHLPFPHPTPFSPSPLRSVAYRQYTHCPAPACCITSATSLLVYQRLCGCRNHLCYACLASCYLLLYPPLCYSPYAVHPLPIAIPYLRFVPPTYTVTPAAACDCCAFLPILYLPDACARCANGQQRLYHICNDVSSVATCRDAARCALARRGCVWALCAARRDDMPRTARNAAHAARAWAKHLCVRRHIWRFVTYQRATANHHYLLSPSLVLLRTFIVCIRRDAALLAP